MERPEDSALDSINAALGLEGEEAHTSDEPPPREEPVAGEEPELQETSEGEGVEDEGAEEGAEAKAIGAKGERNPDGTFKSAAPPKKAADPINDPIPKDLKRETSERIQTLIKTAKEVTAERDQVRTEFDTIVNGIKASGATPEQYGETVQWLALFNSPDPASRMQAYELVNDVADRLATLLNIDRTAANPLAHHADLMQAVASGQLTAKYAGEIARTRNAQAFRGQLETSQRTQQQTQAQSQAQAQQEAVQSRADLNTFETEMKAKDGALYALKREQLIPILQPIFKTLPRREWAQAFRDAYQALRVQPRGVAPKSNGQQPLRGGKNPAGGQAREATSAMEAVNAALARVKN